MSGTAREGVLLTGRYRLAETIGQGGMGRVWRAHDEILDRVVAVKEMRLDVGSTDEDRNIKRARAFREARATARINHPNVVRVYDVVEADERLWIVMELVEGLSLEAMVVRAGPLSVRAAVVIGGMVAHALATIHAAGILHRDVKPGNVLVERSPQVRVVLLDFGIAAIQDHQALTMVGMLVGSPDYMAPERVSGREQGPRSDLWSLGATLYAALAGASPFTRDTTLATLHAVLYEEPDLSAAGVLRPILAALLEKDPAARPSAAELIIALDELTATMNGSPVPSDRPALAAPDDSASSPPPATPQPYAMTRPRPATAPPVQTRSEPDTGREESTSGPDDDTPSGHVAPATATTTVVPPPPSRPPTTPSASPDPSAPRSYIPRKPITAFAQRVPRASGQ